MICFLCWRFQPHLSSLRLASIVEDIVQRSQSFSTIALQLRHFPVESDTALKRDPHALQAPNPIHRIQDRTTRDSRERIYPPNYFNPAATSQGPCLPAFLPAFLPASSEIQPFGSVAAGKATTSTDTYSFVLRPARLYPGQTARYDINVKLSRPKILRFCFPVG
ncbi:hypothetical protein BDV19DRAFT_77133 [Aspergillus venezuelensis]